MRKFLPLLLLLAASACGTVRTLPTSESTRVEVRTETVTKLDTVFLELPVIVERVATLDTISHLENRYAFSDANISGGILTHSLETKPVKEPVPVEVKTVYRDSVVFMDKVQTVTVEVEKKLTLWQKIQMRLGLVTILLLAVVFIYFIFLIINHFKY